MNFEDTLNKMQEKLGKETSSLIADDIASLITYETTRTKDIQTRDDEITKLKKDKEMLIEANGNLLQKVGAESEEILKPKREEESKPLDIKSAFDKYGNFIK